MSIGFCATSYQGHKKISVPLQDYCECWDYGLTHTPTDRRYWLHLYQSRWTFLLITGLCDSLTDDGRVVVLSSGAHYAAESGLELDNLSGNQLQ